MRMGKICAFVFLLLLLQLQLFFTPFVYTNPDWLTGWSYRKSHVINAQSGAGTNYPIRLRIAYDKVVYLNELIETTASTRYNALEKGDTDNDGTQEIVVLRRDSGGNGYLSVYRMDGEGLILEAGTFQTTYNIPEIVKVENIINEGGSNYPEIVICGYNGVSGSYGVFVDIWRYDGATYTKVNNATISFGSTLVNCWSLGLGQLDGSNWKIIIHYHTSGLTPDYQYVKVYNTDLTVSGATNPRSWEDDNSRSLSVPMGIGDVDNDGTIEFLASGRNTNADAFIKVFRWDSTNGITLEQTITTDTFGGTQYDTAEFRGSIVNDIDNDASIEIVTAGYAQITAQYYKSFLRIYSLNFASVEVDEIWVYEDDTYSTFSYIYNLDGAGLNEILVLGYVENNKDFLKVFRWSGSSLTTVSSFRIPKTGSGSADYVPMENLVVHDFNGDSILEVVMAGYIVTPERAFVYILQYVKDAVGLVGTGGKCRTDFGDIRVTQSDGTTVIAGASSKGWIEEKDDSDYAIIWVKIPDSLESAAVTIYVYYGNSGATWSGAVTEPSLFADDYELGDFTRWTSAGTAWSIDCLLYTSDAADE